MGQRRGVQSLRSAAGANARARSNANMTIRHLINIMRGAALLILALGIVVGALGNSAELPGLRGVGLGLPAAGTLYYAVVWLCKREADTANRS